MPHTGCRVATAIPCACVAGAKRRYAGGVAVEVQVSRARCIATQSCIHAAPGVFELDEQRLSTVIDPDAEPLEAVVEAAENCPTGAISVFRDGVQLA
jgi:ferredoxin